MVWDTRGVAGVAFIAARVGEALFLVRDIRSLSLQASCCLLFRGQVETGTAGRVTGGALVVRRTRPALAGNCPRGPLRNRGPRQVQDESAAGEGCNSQQRAELRQPCGQQQGNEDDRRIREERVRAILQPSHVPCRGFAPATVPAAGLVTRRTRIQAEHRMPGPSSVRSMRE